MDAVAWIAEQRIREGMERGFFDNPAWRGRRLQLDDDPAIPPELRMAFKILKDAHCLPPEVELRREIATLSDLLDAVADPAERRRLGHEINDRRLRLALLRPRPMTPPR